MKMIVGLLLFGLFFIGSPALAGDAIDGTKPLLCSSIEALECTPGVPCERGIPELMGAPQFIHIDFAKNEIVGPLRTTKIRSIDKDVNQILLQGFEIGLGWTIAIDRITGNMTSSLAEWDAAYIIFGACTTYP